MNPFSAYLADYLGLVNFDHNGQLRSLRSRKTKQGKFISTAAALFTAVNLTGVYKRAYKIAIDCWAIYSILHFVRSAQLGSDLYLVQVN